MRILLALLFLLPATASAGALEDGLAEATSILKELGPSIPKKVKARADCVSVFQMASGGFIFGGSGGTGFLSCKNDILVAGTVPVPDKARAFHAAVVSWAK